MNTLDRRRAIGLALIAVVAVLALVVVGALVSSFGATSSPSRGPTASSAAPSSPVASAPNAPMPTQKRPTPLPTGEPGPTIQIPPPIR